ncbi:MAG TPA: hypothetical protein VFS92_05095, partial [Planctomycetota bacterium]|nr:hypothetical protein [Planctomycetota bacterium]
VSADEFADAGSISGRLLLPDGKAPEGVGWVLAKPEGAAEGTPAPAFEADPGGEFLAPRLRSGRWTLSASTLDGFRGELPGVVLPPNGSIRVEIRLEPAPPPTEKPPPTIEVEVRPEPAPAAEDAPRLRAWATSWRGTRSTEARWSGGGPLRVVVREADAFAVWVVDGAGKRASVAGIEAPSADRPVEVNLVPAGWIVLPPDPDALDRWVVLRDARETPVYSGFEANLPAVAGEGYRLPVPPGAWSVTVSRGLARRHPRVFRVIVAPGSGVRAE